MPLLTLNGCNVVLKCFKQFTPEDHLHAYRTWLWSKCQVIWPDLNNVARLSCADDVRRWEHVCLQTLGQVLQMDSWDFLLTERCLAAVFLNNYGSSHFLRLNWLGFHQILQPGMRNLVRLSLNLRSQRRILIHQNFMCRMYLVSALSQCCFCAHFS